MLADFAGPAFARAILDAAPAIVLVLDARGRILHYNAFTERLCGRPLAEVLGLDWFDEFLIDEEREPIRAFFANAITTGPVHGKVNSIRARGGELRLIEWHDRKVHRDDGSLASVVVIGVDITERRQAAQKVEELGRIFALFNGSVDEVFLLLSPTRDRVLYASESIERMFGVERPAVYADIGLLVEHMHPDDRERLVATFGQREPSDQVYEFRVLTPEGSTRWIMSRLRTLGPESSMPGAIVAISMDITARHESEEALRRMTEELEIRVAERTRSLELERQRLRESLAELEIKEARLADAQRIADVGDWEWDVTTNKLYWSDQAFRIFGIEVGSIEQTYDGFLAAVHEEDRAGVMAAVDHALRTGGHYEIEHRIVRPDDEVRSILENGEVTRDDRGQPVLMKGTAQDVTRQKQVEAQLRASLGEKEALLHEIHHRVKNNLQVVTSLLYLKGVNASAEIREVLDECGARIRSMALIHEQLYVSGELARIEMRDFLAKLGEELTRVFVGDRMIHIRVTGEGLRLGIERAVPVALLANELLTNALKYAYPNLAPGQEAEVRVRVWPDLLEIADDGVGLPADLDGSTASSLGLRLVHSLARQLDARLEFSAAGGRLDFSAGTVRPGQSTGDTGTCVRLLLSH